MDSVVTAPDAVADPPQTHDGLAAATQSTGELFRWSGYVHLGPGADECEHRLDGQCDEPATRHFHAWVCLPNAYQIRDIQEKAKGARARKVRALRDPESDSGVALEMELDDIRRGQMDELVQAIASRRVDEEFFDIVRDVQGRDEFEHQVVDAEEFQRLSAVEERTTEEEEDYGRLQKQMLDYGNAMQEIIDQRREGEASRLRTMDPAKLLDMERDFRVKIAADEAFLFTYYTWVIYVGTRVPSVDGFPSQRKFERPEVQRVAPPEVVMALRAKVQELETATTREGRGEAAGNS